MNMLMCKLALHIECEDGKTAGRGIRAASA